jgi:hypothetical protein
MFDEIFGTRLCALDITLNDCKGKVRGGVDSFKR